MNQPSIVIAAYNRPNELKRLLNSVQKAMYPNTSVNLIISIDRSHNTEVASIAENFDWQNGHKEVIIHEKHHGLVKHFLFCARLTEKYENIILLEDDLLVSPFFYNYSHKALEFYKDDTSVAGISLYNYCISESSLQAFIPLDDGSDVYFIQYPSSWGLCLNSKNWTSFVHTYKSGALNNASSDPTYVKNWPKESWKRLMLRHLLKSDTYFVFPHLSLSTNFSNKGTNTPIDLNIFQVPLQINPKNYTFHFFSASKSVYDCYFEPTSTCINNYTKDLLSYNYIVDLQGVRDLTQTSATHVLTSRKTKSPLMTYGTALKPLVLNVINKIHGKDLSFSLITNARRKSGKIHYGHTEYIHNYTHKSLNSRFSFLRYFYFYILIELKMFFKR